MKQWKVYKDTNYGYFGLVWVAEWEEMDGKRMYFTTWQEAYAIAYTGAWGTRAALDLAIDQFHRNDGHVTAPYLKGVGWKDGFPNVR
jgi:hypothetical protein